MRPADVEMCCARIRAQGTRAKAARELGWRSETTFEELVRRMVEAELSALGEGDA